MRICSGCQHSFDKTHELFNHRRSFRCGGEWNEVVYVPLHVFVGGEMVYLARPGAKFSLDKPTLVDPSRGRDDSPVDNARRALKNILRKQRRRHKHRTPGTVRASRLPGGSGFRNNWQEDASGLG